MGSAVAANAGLLAVAILWGSQIPLLADLVQRWDPYLLAAIRYAAAWLVLWLLLVLRPGQSAAAITAVPLARLTALGSAMAAFGALYLLGLAFSAPFIAALMSACGPLTAALVARFCRGTPIARGERIGAALAMAGGAVIVVGDELTSGVFAFRGGELLILAAQAAWAWYSIYAQYWMTGYTQLQITTATMAPAAVVLIALFGVLAVSGLAQPWPEQVQDGDFPWIAYVVLGAVVAGVLLWNSGVAVLGVVVASNYLNLIPFVAASLAALMGARPTPAQWIGGAVVLFGVIFGQWLDRQWRASQSRAR